MCQSDLAQVLGHLPTFDDPNLLYGLDALGDAGVYAIDERRAMVQTVDVLTPVVDDPYTFGEIAAANSLSDVYAMGARPLTALNIVGFPAGKVDISVLQRMVQGGCDKVKEAGAVIVGGHTIKDDEPKYGLAVTGIVDRDQIVTNQHAIPGDRLILTKPLGIGVITTAFKGGKASDSAMESAIFTMRTLNAVASQVMQEVGVHACTDITGFGLLGHALLMAQASRVGLRIVSSQVPIIEEAREYAHRDLFPGGSRANFQYVQPHVDYDPAVTQEMRFLLCDAQTSGGLFLAVPEEKSGPFLETLEGRGVRAWAVGNVTEEKSGNIRIL